MIQASRVSKTFGTAHALTGVTLSVADGQVTSVVGPRACGKSTLVKAVASLVVPDSGEISVDHVQYDRAPAPGHLLGVFVDAAWIPDRRTPRQHLARACAVHGVARGRVDEVLSLAGLTHLQGEEVGELTSGQRQRLGIGAALVAEPRNVVLDEPTRGMTPADVEWLRGLLRSLVEADRAVLVSSHHQADLGLSPDHVAVLDQGRVVREGPLSSFAVPDARRTYVEATDMALTIEVLQGHDLLVERKAPGAVVRGCSPDQVGALLATSPIGLTQLRELDPTVEEAYAERVTRSRGWPGRGAE